VLGSNKEAYLTKGYAMNMILSADQAWGIGYQNKLLFKVPGDMRFFRKMTDQKVVVMGRETLESLPNSSPLANRYNIVLSRDPFFSCKGATLCKSADELFASLEQFCDEDIFVIGGEQIYRMLMPYCHRSYITRWHTKAVADSYAPNFEEEPGWQLIKKSAPIIESGVEYSFCIYEHCSPKPRWRR